MRTGIIRFYKVSILYFPQFKRLGALFTGWEEEAVHGHPIRTLEPVTVFTCLRCTWHSYPSIPPVNGARNPNTNPKKYESMTTMWQAPGITIGWRQYLAWRGGGVEAAEIISSGTLEDKDDVALSGATPPVIVDPASIKMVV